MKQYYLSAILSLFLVTSVVAGGAVAQAESDDEPFASLEEMVPTYNANIGNVSLGPVSLGGTSNIYIEDGATTHTYSVTMDKQNRITNLADTPDEDAVRRITTDAATLDTITSATNPAAAFRTAVTNDDIVITGEKGKPLEQLKWGVVNALKGFLL